MQNPASRSTWQNFFPITALWRTGLFAAAGALGTNLAPPVMHLRSMNPYVTAALGDWSKLARLQSRIPLQAAGGNLTARGGAATVAGTSSFGMSGVNAHALLCHPAARQTCAAGDQVRLQPPRPHSLHPLNLQ